MPDILTLLLISFASYILLYGACWSIDKTDIEKHKKKIKLNKYTNILFFLWPRNEKVYWLVYILIISESIVFILLWILYITNIENIFKILFKMYIYIYLLGGLILVIKVLKKRVKDFISGKK
jgi:hypothetical protein